MSNTLLNFPTPFLRLHPDGSLIAATESYYKLLNLEKDLLQDMNFFELGLLNPSLFISLTPTNTEYQQIQSRLNPDSTLCYIQFTYRSVWDKDTLIEYQVLGYDVTPFQHLDPVTNLYTRSLAITQIDRLDQNPRNFPLSVIIIKLEDAHRLQDTVGDHLVINNYLFSIAALLRTAFRSDEIISRWQYDQFLAVLPSVSEPELKKIIDRTSIALSDHHIKATVGSSFKLTLRQNIYHIINLAEHDRYHHKIQKFHRIFSDD